MEVSGVSPSFFKLLLKDYIAEVKLLVDIFIQNFPT